jgi:SAM-dependent methyltransferase
MKPDFINNLAYFVEWKPWIWKPAILYLIDDPNRFINKNVLELGCGKGRLSCLFGLLGANVTGIELEGKSLEVAIAEAGKWNISDRVHFSTYNGDPATLPGGYDFVLTKSVFITIPSLETFLERLYPKINSSGELLLAENLPFDMFLHRFHREIVRFIKGYKRQGLIGFNHGVNAHFMSILQKSFHIIRLKKFYGLVAAITARKAGNE